MCAEFHEWYIAITTVVNQANANSANVHLQRKRKRSNESAEWWFFSCSAECCAHFTAYLLLDMETWNHSLVQHNCENAAMHSALSSSAMLHTLHTSNL